MDIDELLFHVKRSFEKVRADIKMHAAYIEALRAENQLLKVQLQQLFQQNQEEKLHSKKHNKVFVKQKIHATLASGTCTLSDIKEAIVDKEGYCSKATFYRYIEEMKQAGSLVLVENDGLLFVSAPLHATK